MDLKEVEVSQAQSIAGQQSRHRIGGCHQQPIVTVDVIHRRGLGIDEVGQRSHRVLSRPLFAGQQCHRGTVGQRSGIARGHGRVAGLHPEHRPQRSEFLHGGIGAQVVIAVQTEEPGDEIVEEPAVVSGDHIAMAGRGEFVLIDPPDTHLLGGDRRMITHGQTGPRLTVCGNLNTECGGHPADQFETVDGGTCPANRQ